MENQPSDDGINAPSNPTANVPGRVTHGPETANRMHDLLNLFSGLYDWHNFGKGDELRIRNQPMADEIIAEVAALLSVGKEDALHILLTKADHKITIDDAGYRFTYDPTTLPSNAAA